MGFFTRWISPGSCRVLCIGTPPEMRIAMGALLTGSQPAQPLEFLDPYAMFRPLFDELIKICDESVWRITKKVRDIEKVC
jgi:hypothetical protein